MSKVVDLESAEDPFCQAFTVRSSYKLSINSNQSTSSTPEHKMAKNDTSRKDLSRKKRKRENANHKASVGSKNKESSLTTNNKYSNKRKRRRSTERISINEIDSSNKPTGNDKKKAMKSKNKNNSKEDKAKLPKIINTSVGNIVGSSSKQEAIESPDETFWEIEKIVGRRERGNQVEYLVRWKGCPEDQNTWEPLDNLCDSAFREAIKFAREEKLREKKRQDDELRILYGEESQPDPFKPPVSQQAFEEPEEDIEMDAEIEIGEEEDDKWAWNHMEQLEFKPLERIHVNTPNARKKINDYRINGTPFVLVGHKGWASFASRWLKKRDISLDSRKDCNIVKLKNIKNVNKNSTTNSMKANSDHKTPILQPLDTPPELLDLSDPSLTLHVPSMLNDIGSEDVTVVRRNYNEHSPIHGVIPVSKFLKVCWSESENEEERSSATGSTPISSRIYLHQWQFPLSDTAGRKLGHQNVPLDTVLGEDLLCHWLDLPQCIGDNPFQYLFMGREDTHSKLHCDNGGLAITIAPIVGLKECTLVHRLDGMSCLYHLNASLSQPDLNEYPLMANARIWRSVIKPGEILFMPAGTYHECHNVTPCLSYSRFHLDDVNLVPFLRSFYDGDADEMMHDEILWNACIGLMRKVEKIADEAGSGKGRRVTKLEFQTVMTLRKLRNVVKDVTRKFVMRDAVKGESTGGTVQGSHDWFRLVNDLDLCLHEFRYRKYRTGAPPFKGIATNALTTGQRKMFGNVSVSKGDENVVAYDTELENAYVTLKRAPKTWKEADLAAIKVGDILDVDLCKKIVKSEVLEILENVKAAFLSYEEYPSIYDEWQFYENLRSAKGDGADLEESEIREGCVVLNRWGDMKSEYRGKVTKTTNGTMLRVRYLGVGSEVVDRLITPNAVIKKHESAENPSKGDKKVVKETLQVSNTSKNSDEKIVSVLQEQKTLEITMVKHKEKDLKTTVHHPEVSDNSSLSNFDENEAAMLKEKNSTPISINSENRKASIHMTEVSDNSSLSNSGEVENVSAQ